MNIFNFDNFIKENVYYKYKKYMLILANSSEEIEEIQKDYSN